MPNDRNLPAGVRPAYQLFLISDDLKRVVTQVVQHEVRLEHTETLHENGNLAVDKMVELLNIEHDTNDFRPMTQDEIISVLYELGANDHETQH
jgi:hypothetical protein